MGGGYSDFNWTAQRKAGQKRAWSQYHAYHCATRYTSAPAWGPHLVDPLPDFVARSLCHATHQSLLLDEAQSHADVKTSPSNERAVQWRDGKQGRRARIHTHTDKGGRGLELQSGEAASVFQRKEHRRRRGEGIGDLRRTGGDSIHFFVISSGGRRRHGPRRWHTYTWSTLDKYAKSAARRAPRM